jgi:hypothetical protein
LPTLRLAAARGPHERSDMRDRLRGWPRISLLPALFELRQSLIRATKLRDLLRLVQLRRSPYDPWRFVKVIANPN